MSGPKKVVLAYSGGLDTSVILAWLKETYGAEPRALSDVLLLAPADKLDERKQEYPDIEVRPLKFGAAELQTSHWRFLMGAVGNQATYIRQLNRVMKSLRDDLTLEGLNQGIEASSLPDHLKGMAKMRLELASEYIDDSVRLKDEIRPGRLIIVDLRDEFIEKDEALGLFVVLLHWLLFACTLSGSSEISSRNSVPPLASRIRPSLAVTAPV